MDSLCQQAYLEDWDDLNRELEQTRLLSGLGAALDALRAHQVESGFIQDELQEFVRYQMPCPYQPGRFFSAQFNPARARRFSASSAVRDLSRRQVHNGCFLCRHNIFWQHQGSELGFDLPLAGERYTAWMNPYPLLPGHTVVASKHHVPQHWKAPSAPSLFDLTGDLATLSSALPGWIGFYNGVGAGASIPHHLHFHFLPRARGYEQMPLETAARLQPDQTRVETVYPLTFLHWGGPIDSVLSSALAWIESWQRGSGSLDDATVNIIACTAPDRPHLDLYIIPRHQTRSRAEGLRGVLGGFEAMGEIVCSLPDERRRLDNGDVDYGAIAAMLRSVPVAL